MLASRSDTDAFNAYLAAGTLPDGDGWDLCPAGSVQYTDADLGGFTETGGPGALSVAGRDVESLRTLLGARLTREFRRGTGKVVPELRLQWAHEFLDGRTPIQASFAGAPVGPFTVIPGRVDRDSAILGAGVTADLSRNASGYLTYKADVGRDDLTVHAVALGGQLKF